MSRITTLKLIVVLGLLLNRCGNQSNDSSSEPCNPQNAEFNLQASFATEHYQWIYAGNSKNYEDAIAECETLGGYSLTTKESLVELKSYRDRQKDWCMVKNEKIHVQEVSMELPEGYTFCAKKR